MCRGGRDVSHAGVGGNETSVTVVAPPDPLEKIALN